MPAGAATYQNLTEVPEICTVQEAADALRVSPDTINRLINAGDLHAFRAGRTRRLNRNDLLSLFRRQSGTETQDAPAAGTARA